MTKGRERGLPPGWYRDPVHLYAARFWDGRNWTSQVVAVWNGAEDPPSSLDVWMGTRTPIDAAPEAGVVDLRDTKEKPKPARHKVDAVRTNGSGASNGKATATAGLAPDGPMPASGSTAFADEGARSVAALVVEPRVRTEAVTRRTWEWQLARLAQGARIAMAGALLAVDAVLYRKLR